VNDFELAGLEPPKRRGSTKIVDWAAVEKDWLPGLMSLNAIAEKHNVSRTAIDKHFDKLGMKRDLKPQIMAKAEALVAAALVTPVVNTATNIGDKELIEAGAVDVARVLVGQRRAIQRHAALACKLLDELELTTGNRELFEQLGELLHAPNEKGVDKLNEIYNKVIAMPGRVKAFKELTDSVRILIALERQAVGLSDNGNGEADKPPVVEGTVVNNEVARRIAFVLAQASQKAD